MNQLNISIVIYKSNEEQLLKTIKSCLKTTLKSKIYIIDNSPYKWEHQILKAENINYIYNNANLGYGAGHNVAMLKARDEAEFHLVLNPDVYFEKGTLEKLYKFGKGNTDYAVVIPKILYEDGSLQYIAKLLPGPADLFLRRFIPFGWVHKRLNYKYELQFTGYDKTMAVPFVSGCFMFIRAELLSNDNLFDERFRLYMEDVDLSRRLGRLGRLLFYPGVTVYHSHAKESYKSWRAVKMHMASAVKYFNKWGWIFDRERKRINREALKSLGYYKINDRKDL